MTHKDRIAEILAECYERGETPDLEALARAHPELADELAHHLDALELLDKVAPHRPGLPACAPDKIGDFRILREIGRGGMGVVYEAEQTSMKRRVALKVLSLAITGTPQAVKRFQGEAQAAGRLHHTNIVPIHAMGQYGGYWYYAMELIEGLPLSRVIADQRARLGPATEEGLARQAAGAPPSTGGLDTETGTSTRAYFVRLAEVFAGVADALHLAHHEGIIHRDIKPSNLLLDAEGALKIVDFGLALQTDADGPSMTVTGDLLGTPVYMSPEQAMAQRIKIDHRTDIYSLGATLYELVTLNPPFEGKTLHDLCSQIVTKDPALPRRRNNRIPKDLETIVLKAMDKDRDKRYQTGREMARDLHRFAEGIAIHARRIGLPGRAWRKVKRHRVRSALIAAVLLVGIAGLAVALHAARERRRVEYDRLLARGEERLALSAARLVDAAPTPDETARDLFSRAARLIPDRPEAYFLRAFTPGAATLEERDRDLANARERGLTTRTWKLARAFLSTLGGNAPQSAAAIPKLGDAPPIEAYFGARLHAAVGDEAVADQLLSRAIENSSSASSVRYLALRYRALLRRQRGEWSGALEDLLAVQTLGDHSLEVRTAIAVAWFRSGGEDVGEQRFAELLAEVRTTGSIRAWKILIQSCAHLARWRDQAVVEAHQAHQDDLELLSIVAGVQLRAGDLDKATAACERVLAGAPSDSVAHRAHEFRGDALERRGQHANALTAYAQAAKLSATCPTVHTKRSQLLFALRRYEEARDAARRACELGPHNPDAHSRLGVVLQVAFGDSKAALVAFGRVLKLRQSAQDWVNHAYAQMGLEEYAEALVSLTRALECDSRHVGAHMVRGFILSDNLRRYEDAIDAFARVLEFRPDHHDALRCRAVTRARLHRLDAAHDDIERARRLAPDGGLVWITHAETLMRLQRHSEALDSAEKAMARGYNLGRILRAVILADLGRIDEGELALSEWESRAGDSPRRAFFRCVFFDRAGKWNEALDAARAALDRAPDEEIRVESATILVRSLRALGQHGEARKLAREQTQGTPHRVDRLKCAYLCAVAGDNERAKHLLEEWDLPWTAENSRIRARVHAILEDRASALAWLERAVDTGLRWPQNIPPDPDFASLADDPRYQALLERMWRK